LKKLIGFAVGFLLLINIAFGDETISFGVSSGVLSGKISEFVYDNTRTGSDNHLSELYWNFAAPYSSINFELKANNYFFLSFSGLYAYPVRYGTVTGYGYYNSYTDDKFHNIGKDASKYTYYASHELAFKYYFDISISSGANFYLPFDFELTPYFKFKYDQLFMQGHNGYDAYLQNDERWSKNKYDSIVLDYKTVAQSFYLGLRTDIQILNPFVFYVSYELSPYLSFINAYDNHYKSNKEFTDILNNAVRMRWVIDAAYKIKGFQRVELKLQFFYQPETYGEFRAIQKNDGGLKEFITDFSVVYNLYF